MQRVLKRGLGYIGPSKKEGSYFLQYSLKPTPSHTWPLLDQECSEARLLQACCKWCLSILPFGMISWLGIGKTSIAERSPMFPCIWGVRKWLIPRMMENGIGHDWRSYFLINSWFWRKRYTGPLYFSMLVAYLILMWDPMSWALG